MGTVMDTYSATVGGRRVSNQVFRKYIDKATIDGRSNVVELVNESVFEPINEHF